MNPAHDPFNPIDRQAAFQRAAREVKLRGLLQAINAFSVWRGSPVTARELLGFSDAQWHLLAFAARVTMPSQTTRGMLIEQLAERDALIASSNESRVR